MSQTDPDFVRGSLIAMTCRDFQRKCNELLDAQTGPPALGTGTGRESNASDSRPPLADWEPALRDHAAGCAGCRQMAARYHVLRRAIRAWSRPPVPPADLAERILAAAEAPSSSCWPVAASWQPDRPWRLLWIPGAVAAAAVAVALVLPRVNTMVARSRPDRPPITLPIASQDPGSDLHSVSRSERPPLHLALVEATAATWDLARSASEPAARISRDMLDASSRDDEDPSQAAPEGRFPLWPRSPDPRAASAVLQQVGDHLAAGVRPLSSTARHAFGFLLGPAPDRPERRANQPAEKGA